MVMTHLRVVGKQRQQHIVACKAGTKRTVANGIDHSNVVCGDFHCGRGIQIDKIQPGRAKAAGSGGKVSCQTVANVFADNGHGQLHIHVNACVGIIGMGHIAGRCALHSPVREHLRHQRMVKEEIKFRRFVHVGNAGQEVFKAEACVVVAFRVTGIRIVIISYFHAVQSKINVRLQLSIVLLVDNGGAAGQQATNIHHIAVDCALRIYLIAKWFQTFFDNGGFNNFPLLRCHLVVAHIVDRSDTLKRPCTGGICLHRAVCVIIQPIPITPVFPLTHLNCIPDCKIRISCIASQRICQ